MRLIAGILAILLALVVLLAVPVLARRARPWSDCASTIIAATGRNGEPLECACVGATLSACFDPGP